MKTEEAEEWTQSLGQIVAGSWRQIVLAKKLGVPEALGITVEQWVQRVGGYVQLPKEERREAAKELTDEGFSQRDVAEVLGVAQSTVNEDLKTDQNRSGNYESPVKEEEVNDRNRSNSTESNKPKRDEAKERELQEYFKAKKEEERERAARIKLTEHFYLGVSLLEVRKDTDVTEWAKHLLERLDFEFLEDTQSNISAKTLTECANVLKILAKLWKK